MKMMSVAAMLLACAQGTSLNSRVNILQSFDDDAKEAKLSQSFASAFQMAPPKLMTTNPLPGAGKGACPAPGKALTYTASGGAFLDGCYMNTTRTQERDEATGEEAQHYLYMWKHACAYTKWVPSNQFMYSNLDYDAETMTLERFGFIGMEKRCFWGSIGILWKRPLPVNQILPNTTVQVGPSLLEEGELYNVKSAQGDCLGLSGKDLKIAQCKTDGSDVWQYYDDGQIIHKKSGMCLTPVNGFNNNAKVQIADCNGSADQQWNTINGSKGGQFLIQASTHKGQCIDLPGGAGNRGLQAQMYRCIPGAGDNFEYVWKK